MSAVEEFQLDGHAGGLHAQRWSDAGANPRYIALLCHGYGEHIGRYDWVATQLVADGAVVYGMDHAGHGRSGGDCVLIADFEPVVADFRLLHVHAKLEHADLPVVLIGHSMGGMIAARYGQLFGKELACLVLSGPVLGHWQTVDDLLRLDEIPDLPIDTSTLSRDPAVGERYEADPLIWHGPFKRATLEAFAKELETISSGPPLDDVTVLWLHGADDHLVPYDATEEGWRRIADEGDQAQTYRGARHEIFNETNRDEVLADVIAFINRFV